MTGTFSTLEGVPVLQQITISLTTKGGSDALEEWFGSFTTESQHEIEPGEYRLALSDGRSGAVIIYTVRGRYCFFTGNGPLHLLTAGGKASG